MKIKEQVSVIWAKWSVFGDWVSVIRPDMTTPPWWREKASYLIIIILRDVIAR